MNQGTSPRSQISQKKVQGLQGCLISSSTISPQPLMVRTDLPGSRTKHPGVGGQGHRAYSSYRLFTPEAKASHFRITAATISGKFTFPSTSFSTWCLFQILGYKPSERLHRLEVVSRKTSGQLQELKLPNRLRPIDSLPALLRRTFALDNKKGKQL